jgi:hypothetical protein
VLKQLLDCIESGQVGSTAEAAAALEASPALVEAMLGELGRRGLLQRAGDCAAGCGGCATAQGCETGATARVWMLTLAGRRAAGSVPEGALGG